ncbi:hypothetical protein M422DRAFT_269266 [Sphaerobolus stellatus SS14]|uniref:Methyltransferase domain-containing protein n=1 Tax=Sphaerobolus stellatus (strain SS14) TaxID=990650 RepID=A0A0C9UVH4_SPHS4|nr:hypothetical protein M422DRAFT_269266 [Sphaerobolus stellatus SS14]
MADDEAKQLAETFPADPELYRPSKEEIEWLKKVIGIEDEEELKRHAFAVQAEGLAVCPYPCLTIFVFTSYKIAKHPAYQDVLKLGKERPGAIYLETACCFGNDVRKLVSDGYPIENIVATDLQKDFWQLGHTFFRTTPSSFPVPFLTGDIFDPEFLSPASPLPTSRSLPNIPPPPSLISLPTLTPLLHTLSIIHAAAFFHLFQKEEQRELAFLLASLLSPLPGSLILGSHIGLPDTAEYRHGGSRPSHLSGTMFAHSPSSWRDVWVGSRADERGVGEGGKAEEGVFKRGEVEVWAEVTEVVDRSAFARQEMGKTEGVSKGVILSWSVKRV